MTPYAKIVGTAAADVANIGNSPRRQAKVVYQIMPSYSFGDATVGGKLTIFPKVNYESLFA